MEGPLLHVLLRQLQQGLLGRAGSHQHSVHNGVVLPGGGAGGGCQASWEAATHPCPPLLPFLSALGHKIPGSKKQFFQSQTDAEARAGPAAAPCSLRVLICERRLLSLPTSPRRADDAHVEAGQQRCQGDRPDCLAAILAFHLKIYIFFNPTAWKLNLVPGSESLSLNCCSCVVLCRV